MYLNKLKQLVASIGRPAPEDILPCSEDEVNQLEQEMGLTFPITLFVLMREMTLLFTIFGLTKQSKLI